jgi:hypothetical protein
LKNFYDYTRLSIKVEGVQVMMRKKIRCAIKKLTFVVLSASYLTCPPAYGTGLPLVQTQKNINETAKVPQNLAQYEIALRGILTDKGVLKALDTNNELIFKAFESSLKSRLPPDVKETTRKIYDKKKEFLQEI